MSKVEGTVLRSSLCSVVEQLQCGGACVWGDVSFEGAPRGGGRFRQSPEEMLLFKYCWLSRITTPTFDAKNCTNKRFKIRTKDLLQILGSSVSGDTREKHDAHAGSTSQGLGPERDLSVPDCLHSS